MHTVEIYTEVDAKLHVFLASDSSQWSAVCPDRFSPVDKVASTQ